MFDAIIVGAGPAGLFLACDLRRRGLSIALIEQSEAPLIASRGKGLQPRTLEVLNDIGIADRVLEAGRTYPPIAQYGDAADVSERTFTPLRETSDEVPFPNTIMLSQWQLEAFLAERLTELGGFIQRGHRFLNLEQSEASVRGQFEAYGREVILEARFLVGADGAGSATRRALGIAFEGETPPEDGLLVADVVCDGLSRDRIHAWGTSLKEAVLMFPLPGEPYFQFLGSVPAGEEPRTEPERLQELLDARSGGKGPRLGQARWISAWRPNIRVAKRFVQGRAILVGDAAHVHPPTGGQGLNTAIQDAYNLGWKLEHALHSGTLDIVATYEDERRPNAVAVLERTRRLYQASIQGDPQAMQRGDADQQLGLAYPVSPLNGLSIDGSELQPGSRMCDARLIEASGRETTLFTVMRGPAGATISVEASRPEDSNSETVGVVITRDPGGVPMRAATPSSVLRRLTGVTIDVRPDGYVRDVRLT